MGAERGLGAALCWRFAEGGYHVFVAGRSAGKIEQVARTIAWNGGDAQPVVMDTIREEDVIGLFDRALSPRAGLDPIFMASAASAASWPGGRPRAGWWRWPAGAYCAPVLRAACAATGICAFRGGKDGPAHARAKHGPRIRSARPPRRPCGDRRAINGERLRQRRPETVAERGEDALLDTDAIAETIWRLHRQPCTAWAQQIDLRAYKEAF